ncbi:hypothetical protein AA103196_1309 [Ameyamaea chiangmaiensis NBRC 103196]|uniref:DUF6468 domain-containing protein n=1 Tax=Ameyamaea chiangmaiensis TaxID=442969 RepID=A0A850PFL1_9PROT|nr:DUF6468 domain-containing protein [Ameyamaea chiangmaiensis]MBS4075130.1 hypothetical protein [Ameyamaea chiangmaiensis]NVN40692.1 hypothetical protein [Ameyamaea chiangmaiensis]GBQ66181.1 hypothetical protein AA103196_1309 [Ameyamaea chiangmaiensis NBRC 103196]
MDEFQVGLEIFLSVLLTVSITYSMYLGRSLATLRRDRAALADLIASLQDSSRQAEEGIEQLHRSGDSVGRQLGKLIDQARLLRSELATMTEKGEAVSDRLDRALRAGKYLADAVENGKEQASPAAYEWQPPPSSGKPRSLAERDLLRALKMK